MFLFVKANSYNTLRLGNLTGDTLPDVFLVGSWGAETPGCQSLSSQLSGTTVVGGEENGVATWHRISLWKCKIMSLAILKITKNKASVLQ